MGEIGRQIFIQYSESKEVTLVQVRSGAET